MEQFELMKKYLLRSITFENVADGLDNMVRSRERLNKSFVIVSALTVGVSYKNIDVSKFDRVRMGFNDQYVFYKKLSLLPLVGDGGDLAVSQLWLHADVGEFE